MNQDITQQTVVEMGMFKMLMEGLRTTLAWVQQAGVAACSPHPARDQSHQRQDAALAMVVGTHDEQAVFDRHRGDERPDDQQECAHRGADRRRDVFHSRRRGRCDWQLRSPRQAPRPRGAWTRHHSRARAASGRDGD